MANKSILYCWDERRRTNIEYTKVFKIPMLPYQILPPWYRVDVMIRGNNKSWVWLIFLKEPLNPHLFCACISCLCNVWNKTIIIILR